MPQGKGPKNLVDKKQFRELSKHPYSLEELIDYYNAVRSIYRRILATKPDAIIVPLRGALPIVRTIQFFATLERKSRFLPVFYYPRTGEIIGHTKQKVFEKLPVNYISSISQHRRERELMIQLQSAIAKKNKKAKLKVLLLDEALSGGSISKTYSALEKLIKKNRLNVVLSAVSVVSRSENKSRDYRALVSERKIREYPVRRLFTMDSSFFIHPLIESEAAKNAEIQKVSSFWGLPKTMKRFFRESKLEKALPRPMIGFSRKALYGKMALFEDLEALYSGKYPNPLSRLPYKWPKGKRPK